MTTKEPSSVGSRAVLSQYRAQLKQSLEALDARAEEIVSALRIEDQLLPRNAYIGAPGTYARHVYNTLAGR